MNNWYSPSDAVAVVEAYIAARKWAESTFCQQFRLSTPFSGRPGWITRLREGKVQADDIARMVEACAATWPDGAEWPPFVVKPRGEKDGTESKSKDVRCRGAA